MLCLWKYKERIGQKMEQLAPVHPATCTVLLCNKTVIVAPLFPVSAWSEGYDFFFSSQSNLLLLISVSPSQSACWFSMMSTLSELVKVCRERKCLAEGMESSKCNIWKTCWEILRWLSGYFERTWCALKMQKNIKSFLTPLNAKFLLHVSSTQNTFKPTIIGQYFLKIKSNVQKFW